MLPVVETISDVFASKGMKFINVNAVTASVITSIFTLGLIGEFFWTRRCFQNAWRGEKAVAEAAVVQKTSTVVWATDQFTHLVHLGF